MTRNFNVKGGSAACCPACGNSTDFVAHAERIAEDCCEAWIDCTCGYSPPTDERREDVWGALDRETIPFLVQDWNAYVKGLKQDELNKSR